MFHTTVDQHTISCIYALLPNKILLTYSRLLQEVTNLANCTHGNIMIGFEKGMLNTVFVHFLETDDALCVRFGHIKGMAISEED